MFFKGKYVQISEKRIINIRDWQQLIKDMGLEDDHKLNVDTVLQYIYKNNPKYISIEKDAYFEKWGQK